VSLKGRPVGRGAGRKPSLPKLAHIIASRTLRCVNFLEFIGFFGNRAGVALGLAVHSSSLVGSPSSALPHAIEEDRSPAHRASKNNSSRAKKSDANWIMRARFARDSGQTTLNPRTRHLHECLTALR
jgi:hypothetical protein